MGKREKKSPAAGRRSHRREYTKKLHFLREHLALVVIFMV